MKGKFFQKICTHFSFSRVVYYVGDSKILAKMRNFCGTELYFANSREGPECINDYEI